MLKPCSKLLRQLQVLLSSGHLNPRCRKWQGGHLSPRQQQFTALFSTLLLHLQTCARKDTILCFYGLLTYFVLWSLDFVLLWFSHASYWADFSTVKFFAHFSTDLFLILIASKTCPSSLESNVNENFTVS